MNWKKRVSIFSILLITLSQCFSSITTLADTINNPSNQELYQGIDTSKNNSKKISDNQTIGNILDEIPSHTDISRPEPIDSKVRKIGENTYEGNFSLETPELKKDGVMKTYATVTNLYFAIKNREANTPSISKIVSLDYDIVKNGTTSHVSVSPNNFTAPTIEENLNFKDGNGQGTVVGAELPSKDTEFYPGDTISNIKFIFESPISDLEENHSTLAIATRYLYKPQPVNIKYKDMSTGEEISKEKWESGNGFINSDFSVDRAIPIEGYTFNHTDFNSSQINNTIINGKITGSVQNIVYWYTKNKPKVILTKVVDKAQAQVGDILTYTITAENKGTADWKGIIKDALPTEYVDYLPESTQIDGNKIADRDAWENNKLAYATTVKVAQKVNVTFKVKVKNTAKDKRIENVATGETPDNPDDPDNPTPTPPVPTDIVSPKVVLTKVADKTNVKVGEEFTYTITAKNTGEGDWENGTIIDKLPAEYVSLVNGTTTINGQKVDDGTVWKDNVLRVKQSLKAGQSVEIKFTVKATKAAKGHTITNVAETDDPNTPPTPPVDTKVVPDNNPKTPTHPVDPSNTKNYPNGGLPKTGEYINQNLLGLGLLLLVVVAILGGVRIRKSRK